MAAATLAGGLVFWLQKGLFAAGFENFALIDYADFPVWFGFLQGAGAILGDLVKKLLQAEIGDQAGRTLAVLGPDRFCDRGNRARVFVVRPPRQVL